MFAPLSFGYSCTLSPVLSMKDWMFFLWIIFDALSSKRLTWTSKKSTWGFRREDQHMEGNGPWIHANHNNPYILTVNCGLPHHWVCCNVYLGCVGCFGAPPQGGWNTFHKRGWRLLLCTRMVLSQQSGSSTPYHPWRTYRFISYFSSYHLDQIQYCRNSTLTMDKVGFPAGCMSLLLSFLEVLLLSVDMAEVEKKTQDT